ncbi:MAG: hypothetical protein ACE1Y2_04250, partial [Stenotrophomonas maltophilia]
ANDGQATDEGASENYPDAADRTDRTGKQEARPVRPLLAGDDTLERIKALLEERAGVYSQAHYSIPTDDFTPEQVARRIIEIWKAETSQDSSRRSREGV